MLDKQNALYAIKLKPICLAISVKMRMINYWYKLIHGNDNKLIVIMYKALYNMCENNTFKSNWLHFICQTLNENGFGYIWYSQAENVKAISLKSLLYERLTLQFKQLWSTTMIESSKCILYKEIKSELVFEKYLLIIPINLLCHLVKFRTCNHRLKNWNRSLC